MPIERPTFHESWYRVTALKPRLRSTVHVVRQQFRGQTWHVLQDHTNNAFFRLSEPAYHLVGLLDGYRSIGDAWKICSEQLGDDAPTQGEAIQLLGQLYTSNLLQSDLPPDSQTLFDRYKKRKSREVQSILQNLLFARIPILDPDLFLDRTMWLFGWIFSWAGLVVWLILIAIGLYSMTSVPHWFEKMSESGRNILDPSNLPLLYLGFALIKACHEFGHAISCKKFGRSAGGGEVHVVGIMLLVFTPVPYVDASSSWAFQSKWERIMVGAAGMWVELGIASVMAVIWANSFGDHNIQQLAFNIMFVASVSTVLFNANPLLRYDGYYMLADVLEMPNLAQRSKDFFFYIVKRYAWGLQKARDPAQTRGERIWLAVYAVSSFAMRVFVSVSILLFVADKLFILGVLLAIAGAVGYLLKPLIKFLNYLVTSAELSRVRSRAVWTTVGTAAAFALLIGVYPYPYRSHAEGVIEPIDMASIYAKTAGQRTFALEGSQDTEASGEPQAKTGEPLVKARNTDLEGELVAAQADLRRFETLHSQALAAGETALAVSYRNSADTKAQDIARIQEQIADLNVTAPFTGVWVGDNLDLSRGQYLKRGDQIGVYANLDSDRMMIRATAPQEIAGLVNADNHPQIQFRILGRPDDLYVGTLREKYPAGDNRLPSAALGYTAGGDVAVNPSSDPKNPKGAVETNEHVFEVRIDTLRKIVGGQQVPIAPDELLTGQRVVVRFDFGRKPLLAQLWVGALQLVQRRFQL